MVSSMGRLDKIPSLATSIRMSQALLFLMLARLASSRDESLIVTLPPRSYGFTNGSTTTLLQLTCALEGYPGSGIEWSGAAGTSDVQWRRLDIRPEAFRNLSCSQTNISILVSNVMLDFRDAINQRVTRIRCSSTNNTSIDSETELIDMSHASDTVSQCTGQQPDTTRPASTQATAVPLIGNVALFWAVVAVAGSGWFLLVITLGCTSRVCRQKEPGQDLPNNGRPRKVQRPDLEKLRRESAAEIRQKARQEVMGGNPAADGKLFSNPLFESESLRLHSEEPRRPPLRLPSEMNDPSTAWPHAQGVLSSSASQPHLHGESTAAGYPHTNVPPLLPRPSEDARPRLSRPINHQDRPMMSLPRPSAGNLQVMPSPRPTSAGVGDRRSVAAAADTRPPEIPTTQRPTLPRSSRTSETALDAGPSSQLIPHTVPKRDPNGTGMPVARAGHSPDLMHTRSTSILERYGSDYLEPTIGEGIPAWSGPLTPPQPQEYEIANESQAIVDAMGGEHYMDMFNVKNSQPQAPLVGLNRQSQLLEGAIVHAPVDIPRRVRRPSSPTSPSGAPNFRRTNSKTAT